MQVLNLQMAVGIDAPVPHFSHRLAVNLHQALRCFDYVVANGRDNGPVVS